MTDIIVSVVSAVAIIVVVCAACRREREAERLLEDITSKW